MIITRTANFGTETDLKMATNNTENGNSFYRFGGPEILSIEQDELSNLWKIKLSTEVNYVVSEEFDRTKGLYANAPDTVVLDGLMGFSESLLGQRMSVFDVMHMFIERCFDDNVFSSYTENAIWMSMEYPQYIEVEEMLSTYNARLRWFSTDYPMGEVINNIIFKQPNGEAKNRAIQNLLEGIRVYKITSAFMHDDKQMETFLNDSAFQNFPIFKAIFKNNGEKFLEFKYWRH